MGPDKKKVLKGLPVVEIFASNPDFALFDEVSDAAKLEKEMRVRTSSGVTQRKCRNLRSCTRV